MTTLAALFALASDTLSTNFVPGSEPNTWVNKESTAAGEAVEVKVEVTAKQNQVIIDEDGNAYAEKSLDFTVSSPVRFGSCTPARAFAVASLLAETASFVQDVKESMADQVVRELLQTKEERETAMKSNADRRNQSLATAILSAHLKDECKHMRLGAERAFTDELLSELALGSTWRIEVQNKTFSLKVTGIGNGATVTRLA